MGIRSINFNLILLSCSYCWYNYLLLNYFFCWLSGNNLLVIHHYLLFSTLLSQYLLHYYWAVNEIAFENVKMSKEPLLIWQLDFMRSWLGFYQGQGQVYWYSTFPTAHAAQNAEKSHCFLRATRVLFSNVYAHCFVVMVGH